MSISSSIANFLDRFYDGNYKRYMILPLVLIVVFFVMTFIYPGVQPGIDMKGGNVIIIRSAQVIPQEDLKQALESQFNLANLSISSISSPTGHGVIIQFAHNQRLYSFNTKLLQARSLMDSNPQESERLAQEILNDLSQITSTESLVSSDSVLIQVQQLLDQAKAEFSSSLQTFIFNRYHLPVSTTAFQAREVSPTVGTIFWQTSMQVAFFAVIFLIIVVFALFRAWIPALAIIFAGVFDVLTATAFMPIMGIELSLPTISALLMLMGYSIDTDVLLTSRVLRGVGLSFRKRAAGSMKTGLLMTITAIAAVTVMAVFSYWYQMVTIYEIAIVLLFGLLGDIIATWLFNAPIVINYAEKKFDSKQPVRGAR